MFQEFLTSVLIKTFNLITARLIPGPEPEPEAVPTDDSAKCFQDGDS